jgi:hypothetical protein
MLKGRRAQARCLRDVTIVDIGHIFLSGKVEGKTLKVASQC